MEYVLRFLKNSLLLVITFLKSCFPKMRRKTFSCFASLALSAVLFIRSDNGALDSTLFNGFFGLLNASCFSLLCSRCHVVDEFLGGFVN